MISRELIKPIKAFEMFLNGVRFLKNLTKSDFSSHMESKYHGCYHSLARSISSTSVIPDTGV
jgi:hypothetical protein